MSEENVADGHAVYSTDRPRRRILRSMQEGHAAAVERIYESWNQAAAGGAGVEQIVASHIHLLDPEIEFVNPPEAVDPGVRHGIEGWTAALRNLHEGLGIDRIEIERLEEDGDSVAVSVLQHGRAPGSGIEMSYPPRGSLWTFRERRVARFEWFVEPEQAFTRLARTQRRGEETAPSG